MATNGKSPNITKFVARRVFRNVAEHAGNAFSKAEPGEDYITGRLDNRSKQTGRLTNPEEPSQSEVVRNRKIIICNITGDDVRTVGEASRFSFAALESHFASPVCWKCYVRGAIYSCENCGKHFHKECAFMWPGFPDPVFSKPLDEAYSADASEVSLLKCPNCLLAEETQVRQLMNVSQEDLNKVLYLVTEYINKEKAGNLISRFQVDDTDAMSLKKITEKTCASEYKTIEGYYFDFRMIVYAMATKYAVESEATEVARKVLTFVEGEIQTLLACIRCKLRCMDATGRYLNCAEYKQFIILPCEVPHVVLWEKESSFPFWPAKLLSHDVHKGVIIIQCFGEAVTRVIPFPSDKWVLQDCELYLKNLQELFGEEGIVIPARAEPFDGDVESATKRMFPLYNQH